MQPRILLIEDENAIRNFLRTSLRESGYRLNEAADGEQGIRQATQLPPDLVILDLGLPGVDGIAVIRKLREWSQVPILVLSARDQEMQKIEALDAGADDYITKPFSLGELLARIRVALRHVQSRTSESIIITFGSNTIDLEARIVYRGGEEVHLTPIEYKLLVTMIQHANKVLTHRFLLKEVWGPGHADESHYVRVFVANLRRKLERDSARPDFFLTEPGVGYRFLMQADKESENG